MVPPIFREPPPKTAVKIGTGINRCDKKVNSFGLTKKREILKFLLDKTRDKF